MVTAKPTLGVRARALAKIEAGESVAGAIASSVASLTWLRQGMKNRVGFGARRHEHRTNCMHDHTSIYNRHIFQDSRHFLVMKRMMALVMVSLLFAIIAGNFLLCSGGCEATEQKCGM